MELLTAELRAQLPALYAQEKETDPMVYAKFFTPWSDWTWFVMEGQQDDGDFIFFGLVCGFERELGYFSLNELQELGGPFGLTVERDLHFTPKRKSEITELKTEAA